jgi:hypothetical protein
MLAIPPVGSLILIQTEPLLTPAAVPLRRAAKRGIVKV